MTDFRTRFAPSPTGRLHLGHAFSAALVRQAADAVGGVALLRIEDIDQTRCRPEFKVGLLEDLAWLGFAWDEPVRRQSDHFPEYAETIDALAGRGLLYRCFRSRREIEAETGGRPEAPFTGEALPPEEERARLETGAAFAWRLSLQAALDALGPEANDLTFAVEGDGKLIEIQADPARFGDIALTRKDSPVAYHLAACHDDALQGITHIIRGEDLIDAPHIHTLLQALMDWPRPIYRHHTLLMGPDGKRLAKRDKSTTIASLRAAGHRPADVLRMAGVPPGAQGE